MKTSFMHVSLIINSEANNFHRTSIWTFFFLLRLISVQEETLESTSSMFQALQPVSLEDHARPKSSRALKSRSKEHAIQEPSEWRTTHLSTRVIAIGPSDFFPRESFQRSATGSDRSPWHCARCNPNRINVYGASSSSSSSLTASLLSTRTTMFSLRECNAPSCFSPGISIAEVRRAIDRPAITWTVSYVSRAQLDVVHHPRRRHLLSSRLVADRSPRLFDLSLFGARPLEWKIQLRHHSVRSFTTRSNTSGYEFTRGFNRESDRWFSSTVAVRSGINCVNYGAAIYSAVLHLSAWITFALTS